jgi:hypothetical protein
VFTAETEDFTVSEPKRRPSPNGGQQQSRDDYRFDGWQTKSAGETLQRRSFGGTHRHSGRQNAQIPVTWEADHDMIPIPRRRL